MSNVSPTHKPGLFKKLWIMLGTGGVVLNTSVKSIVRVRLNRMTRVIADAYIFEWSRRMLRVVDLRIKKVEFARPITYQAQCCYIIMSNHASHYDIPIIFQTLPGSIRMLAKKELFKIPLFGRMLRENEFPSIDRDNRKQAIKDLGVAETIMRGGIVLWIAPEGTRSKHPAFLGPFKKGGFILALKSQAVIIPVGIRGSSKILPANTWDFSPGEDIEVHVGEPINSANFTDKDKLLEYVEDQISTLANVPKYSEYPHK
ncbi:MAG: lysophospholipid acyltransferase family protein [Gammaproteobacteria bacterium]